MMNFRPGWQHDDAIGCYHEWCRYKREQMQFEQFWNDPRIPKRMKRCGPAPVRKALQKRPKDEWEGILASLAGYDRNRPDYADYCHLSTYINQERDKVEWDEMDETPKPFYASYEHQREESRKLIERAKAEGRYPRMVKS